MLIAFKVKIELSIILLASFSFEGQEEVSDAVCGKCGLAKYAHDLNDRPADFKVMLDDGNEAVGDNGNVYLDSDGIFGLSPESLDLKVLFNPLEEEFDLPSVLVKECDVLGRKVEVVRIIRKCPMKVFCIVNNASDGKGIVLPVPLSCEADGLVSQDIVPPFKQVFSSLDDVVRTELLTYDEECSRLLDGEESGEVKVASVKHIAGKRLVCEPVHGIDIVQPCGSNPVEHGNLRDDIDLGVDLDARLRTSELCPTKYRQAEVDGGRVHSIEPAMQFELLRNAPGLGNGHHVKGKLLKDPVVSEVVDLGKRTLVDGSLSKSEMKRLLSMGGCNIREFPQSTTTHKLSEHKDEKLAPVRRGQAFGPVVELDHKTLEKPLWKEAGYLSENVLSDMHICPKFDMGAKVRISKVRQGFCDLLYCA